MRLFYRTMGVGKPLIILHGLFGMSDNWVSMGKMFAKTHQVFLLDLRNHGQSPHSEFFNYEALAQDVFDFIQEQNLNEIVLLGHSMGGKTAMQLAGSYPERVEKLVIADISPGKYSLHHWDIVQAMLDIDFNTVKSRHEVEAHLSKTITKPAVRQLILKNLYWVDKTRLGWKLNINAISRHIDAILDAVEMRNIFTNPTLFIRGGNSNYIEPHKDSVLIQKHFPNYTLKTISNASHWLHAEFPEEFYTMVSDFLN